MLIFAAVLAAQVLGQGRFDPVGLYVPDFSKAKGKWSSALKGVFPDKLYLGSDGGFIFTGSQREGYWRAHDRRVVLVYSSFFALRYAVPTDVLKKSWPDSELTGLVFDIDPDGTLRLKKVGRVGGPVIFRKARPLSVRALVVRLAKPGSDNDIEAMVQLFDLAPRRWRDLLRIANDPHESGSVRQTAASNLPPQLPEKSATVSLAEGKATLEIFKHLNVSGLTDRQTLNIHRLLAWKLCNLPYKELVPDLLAAGKRFKVRASPLARSIANSGYVQGIPMLIAWLHSDDAGERSAGCSALAKLNAKEALPDIRSLVKDKDPYVQFEAQAAIAKLSSDPAEQVQAMKTLTVMRKGEPFADAVVADALRDTGSKLALPFLINMLKNGNDESGRRSAAEALGDMGFPEAVPALIEAKHVPAPERVDYSNLSDKTASQWWTKNSAKLDKLLNREVEVSPTQQAVVEALWKFDHRRKK